MKQIVRTFIKTVTISGNSANAVVDIKFGTTFKGEEFQEIVMRNTGNGNIYDIKNDFEEFKLSIEDAVRVIENEGFIEITKK